MKSPNEFTQIFIHKDPVDMRKSINGLSAIVELSQMGNLMAPHLFVFTGKRRNAIKILYFDKSGFALWMKRLETDKFPWPKNFTESVITVTAEQLSWLLDGYDIWKMRGFKELNFSRVV